MSSIFPETHPFALTDYKSQNSQHIVEELIINGFDANQFMDFMRPHGRKTVDQRYSQETHWDEAGHCMNATEMSASRHIFDPTAGQRQHGTDQLQYPMQMSVRLTRVHTRPWTGRVQWQNSFGHQQLVLCGSGMLKYLRRIPERTHLPRPYTTKRAKMHLWVQCTSTGTTHKW